MVSLQGQVGAENPVNLPQKYFVPRYYRKQRLQLNRIFRSYCVTVAKKGEIKWNIKEEFLNCKFLYMTLRILFSSHVE